jgi:uncharacterized repeat protein (TIGR01451 family)
MKKRAVRFIRAIVVCAIAFGLPAALPAAALSADLSVVKTRVSGNPAHPGELIVYHMTVSNAGPDAATNVVLSDATPANTTLGDRGGPGGAWDCSSPSTFQCTTPTLAANTTVSGFIMTVQPIDASVTPIVNTATVASDTPDPDTTNNSSSVSTDVAVLESVPVSAAALGILGILLAVAGAFLGKR